MILSLLFYCGAALLAGSLLLLIPHRTRLAAARTAPVAAVAMVVSLTWPVHTQHAAGASSHLDAVMPVWQFGERHDTWIAAPPERVFDAVRSVTPEEILFFRSLTAIRRLGQPSGESILNAPERQPLLTVARRTGFRYLADDPPRELVIGSRIGPRTTAVMNFLVTAENGGSRLTTETRVCAGTPSALRAFSVYWRIIEPGSDIIRRMWLRAIRRRAEGEAPASPTG